MVYPLRGLQQGHYIGSEWHVLASSEMVHRVTVTALYTEYVIQNFSRE